MAGGSGGHKREYFRLKMDHPLCADMTIVLVKGKQLEIGSTKVLVEDISGGGLRFLSHLKMPASDQLVLQFETELCEVPLKMHGHVVRSQAWGERFYEYAVRFTMEEAQHQEINRLVNQLAIRFRNNRGITAGPYWRGDRQAFLQDLAQAEKTLKMSKT
ncbi:PilZ domain-containing protein [Brevibacillus gelatini]|uniref:PilZ domain-containing protein n=1 Tax=Brevibacillus gelatini TaxID=1655277 RepID=A0A3M8B0E8_9BACL|nr:PilZ domain-containing protein [Brevibacillus gelatini]RNB56941.1 PilZ domain-containing protein [Brevibacillus gelatini]